MIVNPPIVAKSSRVGKLKHVRRATVWSPLRPCQLHIKETGRPRRSVETGPEVLELSLQRQIVVAGGIPVYVAGGENRSVEIGVGEDGAHLAVPGAAQGAAVVYDGRDRAVGGGDGGVDDVDAVFVGVGRVAAFPGCDAAAAAAQGDLRVCGPEGAEA